MRRVGALGERAVHRVPSVSARAVIRYKALSAVKLDEEVEIPVTLLLLLKL